MFGRMKIRSRVDVVEQRFLRPIGDVHATDGDGDHVGARRSMGVGHHGVRRVFPGADDQARAERPARDDQRI